ncbi:MAG: ABC transporter substrate-binding protein [Chloroflexota bacterium]
MHFVHRNRFIALLFLMLIAGCSPASQSQATTAQNKKIVYGLTLEPSGIDPHVNASSELGIPLRQVYDTLVYRDPTTKDFVAGLATSWVISDDGLSYTFSLRQNVKFHDGTPFNAQAVATNLDRITNPDTGSQKALFMLGPYVGYDIVDDFTIRMKLSTPFSPLLDSLSQVYLGIASPMALSQYSVDRYQFHQVGTGPFTFVEYVPGDRIVLKRNPDYWGGPGFYQAAMDTSTSVNEIEFRFFTDAPTRSVAITSGDAQIMGEIPPLNAKDLSGNSAIRLLQVPVPGQPLQFLMNTKRFPTDKLEVRQALLYGTNRSAIVDAVFQRFSPIAWGPISANTLYYSRSVNGLYAQDIGQAQTLLEGAGYKDTNADGILDIGGVNLELTIIIPPWGSIPDVAQLLQDQWQNIGVKVNLEPVPTLTALREKVKSGEYNLVAFYSFGLDPAFLNDYYLTNGNTNWTGFSSPDLDKILQDAVTQTDTNVRKDLYAQAQKIIMDEALILPIRDYVNLDASQSTVKGLSFDPYGWYPLLTNVSLANSS